MTAPDLTERLRRRLAFIYGEDTAAVVLPGLLDCLERHRRDIAPREGPLWSERDAVLITYGDSILGHERTPLQTLKCFIDTWLPDTFSTVHLLPIFPYTSDDGFSVVDYREVRHDLGDWDDVRDLCQSCELMQDFVLNHCSRASLYFSDFRADREPHRDFFITVDDPHDPRLAQVVRPRSTPLLTEIPTHDRGLLYVWTTFSADQVDFNYHNPRVLLEMVDILLFYIARGARMIRLDAVGYLWKELGTSCIHLPQTHEIVKLLRDVVDAVAPGVLLVTETNVPHEENISYFGRGDEAHLVYQFSLPPLTLHAIERGTGRYLTRWARSLTALPAGCTYFNFTASHDGIGVRPLEGLLPAEEIDHLLEAMRAKGGFVSTRTDTDGNDVPYEINISWFDAFRDPGNLSDPWQTVRFILSQTLALSLQGIPGVYIHALLATPNDFHKTEVTGQTRAINRHQWHWSELEALLDVPETNTRQILDEYTRRLRLRARQPAFHPDAAQEVLDLGDETFAILRLAPDGSQRLAALFNFTRQRVWVDSTRLEARLGSPAAHWYDLLRAQRPPLDDEGRVAIMPYDALWLVTREED